MIKTKQENQDLSLNERFLKGVFGATKEEIASMVKTADWTTSVQLAEQASQQIGGGVWMPAISVASDEPMAVLWQWLENPRDGFRPRITPSVFCYMDGYEWATISCLPKMSAQDLVIHPEHLARAIASTETPTMERERLSREARAAAKAEVEKETNRLRNAALEVDAWNRRVGFFSSLYRKGLRELWSEKFIQRDELDYLLDRFETKGLLRDEAEVRKALRNQLMDHMAVPDTVERNQDPTQEQLSAAADTLASWINGELFEGVNPLAIHHAEVKAAADNAAARICETEEKKQAETMANSPFAKLALLKK